MDIGFDGKRALVTGAGKGIGRAVAVALDKGGAQVVALSRTVEDLEALQKECSGITTVVVDLLDWDGTEVALADVGPVDLLVNNAGVADNQPFLEVTKAAWDRTFDTNVKAVFHVSQLVARAMRDKGSGGAIVNVSSVASQRALQNHTAYCSSKGALDMLTKVMALELAPYKIRVNSVHPTVVMTSMGRREWSDPSRSAALLTRIPMGRFVEEEEVVNCILFLLSNASEMVHGAQLTIDGGQLIN
uniref:L-xylulose reductase n=1 Tax=Myxine glutinosa TaxID=7769 RepID=UPI00358E7187